MKRLTFKPEFVDAILSGHKTWIYRWDDKRFKVGDVVAAVTRTGDRPAFLVPAKDAFARLRIVATSEIPATDCLFDKVRWYQAGFECEDDAVTFYRNRQNLPAKTLHGYGFEVVEDSL